MTAGQSGIIFGLVPDATVGQILSGFVGTADSIAMEGLTWTGVESESWGKVKSAVASHDYLAICYWLKANPDANRISGPNAAAAADWLVKAGCPAEYVRPDSWLLLRFPGQWFAGTSLADGVLRFPHLGGICRGEGVARQVSLRRSALAGGHATYEYSVERRTVAGGRFDPLIGR